MKIRSLQVAVFAGGALVTILAFQNCSKGLNVMKDPESALFEETASCMASSPGACVFRKNAVAQTGKSVTMERIGGYQSLPVSLLDRDGSGYLQNGDLIVTTSSTPRLTAATGFRQYYTDANSNVEQAMAYYYANELRRWMIARGAFAGAGQAIQIIVDSSFNGWIPSKKEIHLERNGKDFPAALDGSVIVNLYAQASIWAASGGLSHTNTGNRTIACANAKGVIVPGACCTANTGCGPAIVSGAADYLSALMFKDMRTAIGEGWKNSLDGLKVCSLARDPAVQSSLTAVTAGNRCNTRGSPNQVTSLGIMYSSIWWEARKSASDKNDFDLFFLRHLEFIRGEDSFATIKASILALDASDFSSRYTTLMTNEFARRGL